MSDGFDNIAESLASTARALHVRGWLNGTSGNLSAVVNRDPLRLAMTPSGADKGDLTQQQILLIDEHSNLAGTGDHRPLPNLVTKPSDESPLHIRIVKELSAGAVLHTHSIWNTMLSDYYFPEGGVAIEGYEMLKGLQGVNSHEHREWLPIIENSQDMALLADQIGNTLANHRHAHGFLLRRHGLYTWGSDLAQARRHIEILEFLLEILGRTLLIRSQERA